MHNRGQTPGEKYLISKTVALMKQLAADGRALRLLNVGAGTSLVLENSIQKGFGGPFVCDRMDVSDCTAQHAVVGQCFVTSVEHMPAVKTADYDLAFANYVLEHLEHLDQAAAEIARILKPGGYFVTSLPNPRAPEFILSKYTPTSFHQLIKGHGEGSHAHETHYAYKNIKHFVQVFEKHFTTLEVRFRANTYGYLYHFPVLHWLGKAYDGVVNALRIKPLMGNVCIVFKKK